MASDIRKNYFRASYLFIMKFILKYSDKKRQGIHWSTLKVHCARCKATLYLAASGVLGNRCINMFPLLLP